MIGNQHTAQRIINAETEFLSTLVASEGITMDEAEKVLRVYRKAKAVKLDPVMGRINVVHGAFLDHKAIMNAIRYEER